MSSKKDYIQELVNVVLDLNEKLQDTEVYYNIEISKTSIALMRFDRTEEETKLDYFDIYSFVQGAHFIYFWQKDFNENMQNAINYLKELKDENK